MKRIFHISSIGMLGVIILLSGCANNNNQQGQQNGQNQQSQQAQSLKSKGFTAKNMNSGQTIPANNQEAIIPIVSYEGREYISLGEYTDLMEFIVKYDTETERIQIGDNDVAYELSLNSTDAMKEGEVVKLASPPVTIEGETYISKDSVETLFGDVMKHNWTNKELRIQSEEEMSLEEADKLPDFIDDPNDPNGSNANSATLSNMEQTSFGDLALADVNMNKLIDTAKKYIGVKYEFGADPFPKSNRFDCSTFTQHVYGQHNVTLPRLSRNQAEKGVAVSKSSLRKGDLMFFYLPGRYKSNDIVGHVGIYIGDGDMIHASTKPKDGVQITSINKAFWKKTYLKSRRVAS